MIQEISFVLILCSSLFFFYNMSHVYFLMFSVTIYTLDVTFKYPPQNNLVAVVVVVVFIIDIIFTIIV